MTGSPSRYLAGEIVRHAQADGPVEVGVVDPVIVAQLVIALVNLIASCHGVETPEEAMRWLPRKNTLGRIRKKNLVRDAVRTRWHGPRQQLDYVTQAVLAQLDKITLAEMDALYAEAGRKESVPAAKPAAKPTKKR